MFCIFSGPVIVKERSTSSPIMNQATVAAVTDDISSGTIDDMVRSRRSTSRVNTIPAMGALNIPDTAPAAPHPISRVTYL